MKFIKVNSRQGKRTSVAHYAVQAHVKLMRVFMSNWWESSCQIDESLHVKFMRVFMSNWWESSCQIDESLHVKLMRVFMSNWWESSCQIDESICSQGELMWNSWKYLLARRAHVKFMKVFARKASSCQIHESGHVKFAREVARTALRSARAHVKFMKLLMSNSWKWPCEIHERSCSQGDVKFMKEVAPKASPCEIH